MSKSNSFIKVDNSGSYGFELEAWKEGKLVFGVDEVGRGCLSGPVVACCLALRPFSTHELMIDSKILTENKLLEASAWIKHNSVYAFGVINASLIDELNIYQATQLAMKRAYFGLLTHPLLPKKPSCVLIDAVPLELDVPVFSFIKGESKSVSIAAASIMAKVYRDKLLQVLAPSFPVYSFNLNKGYGTVLHQGGIGLHGLSLAHRKTFKINTKKSINQLNQGHLFDI